MKFQWLIHLDLTNGKVFVETKHNVCSVETGFHIEMLHYWSCSINENVAIVEGKIGTFVTILLIFSLWKAFNLKT